MKNSKEWKLISDYARTLMPLLTVLLNDSRYLSIGS